MSGTFEQILAVVAVLFLINYVSAYAALMVLRRREPDLPRPYRAFGFPATTIIVLVGCLALWVAAMHDDPHSALFAFTLMVLCAPLYLWLARRRSGRVTGQAQSPRS